VSRLQSTDVMTKKGRPMIKLLFTIAAVSFTAYLSSFSFHTLAAF
jgi:hypothetical protein